MTFHVRRRRQDAALLERGPERNLPFVAQLADVVGGWHVDCPALQLREGMQRGLELAHARGRRGHP